jgi:hypothetical protein
MNINLCTAGVCDFESIDNCGYVNDPTNQIDWQRTQAGSDPSLPAVDNTYGSTHGHFMLLKASNALAAVNSRLVTISYPDTSGSCVRWYMILDNRVTLRVRTYAFGALNPTFLYTITGGQGPQWKLAQATVRSASPYQVAFEGTVNSTDSDASSIAIDDVEIQPGICARPAACDFERDLCGYQPLKADFDWKRTSIDREGFNAPIVDHTTNSRTG